MTYIAVPRQPWARLACGHVRPVVPCPQAALGQRLWCLYCWRDLGRPGDLGAATRTVVYLSGGTG